LVAIQIDETAECRRDDGLHRAIRSHQARDRECRVRAGEYIQRQRILFTLKAATAKMLSEIPAAAQAAVGAAGTAAVMSATTLPAGTRGNARAAAACRGG